MSLTLQPKDKHKALKYATKSQQNEKPDRHLDFLISRIVGEALPRPYTSSIDAAVSLLPSDCDWVREPDHFVIVYNRKTGENLGMSGGRIRSPAKSIVAACLRAHVRRLKETNHDPA